MFDRMQRLGRFLRRKSRMRFDVRSAFLRRTRSSDHAHDALLAPGVGVYRDGLVFVDRQWSPAGITDQFIADAETYHRRYFERLDFDLLLDRCLTLAGIDRSAQLRVLDIGSGSGSSVFAACRLLPRAEIIAADISPRLLGMLATFVATRDELRGRVEPFCFDLHRPFFRRSCFDLVIGAAILHHLLDPRAALSNVAASLKPGGRIILVEPLESGSLVLSAVYACVLKVLTDEGDGDGPLARLMRALRLDIQCRLGPPRAKPWSALLDDKWIFDEPYLMELAGQLGMATVAIHPAQSDLTHIYEVAFRSVLADSGNAAVSVPEAALDAIRGFDRSIGADLKERLCPTGIIVFTK